MKTSLFNFFKKHFAGLTSGVFVFSIFCSCFSLCLTKDFQTEMLCNTLTLPRQQKAASYKPSMIQVKYINNEDFDLYEPLFYTYVYNQTVDRDGIITDKSICFSSTIENSAPYSISLDSFIVSQFIYTEVETKDTKEDMHILRHGRYALYLPISNSSAGANEFAYISDILANEWIDCIGPSNIGIEETDTKAICYKKLIAYLDSFHNLFEYEGEQKTLFKITNVYYSDFGYAPRVTQIHGNFILSYALCRSKTSRQFDYHYEVETHIDTFGNKRFLRNVESLYGSKAGISFFTPFGSDDGQLTFNQNLTKQYQRIRTMNSFSWGYLLSFILYTLFFVFLIIFRKKNKFSYLLLFVVILTFIIYGFLSTFLYLYTGFGVVVLIYLLTLFIFIGKGALHDWFIKKQTFNKAMSGYDVFYEVNI